MHYPSKFLCVNEQVPGLNGKTVGDFWRWAYSDILSNTNRSVFAEYLVGEALNAVNQPREEWCPVDLYYGQHKIEVKSSAYCQSWHQTKTSTIQFGIGEARFWDGKTATYHVERTRSADVYVFCVHAEKNKAVVNVLDVEMWDFYVASTDTLRRDFALAKSISLARVQSISKSCKWAGLKHSVDAELPDLTSK